jgi:hypothetical protein
MTRIDLSQVTYFIADGRRLDESAVADIKRIVEFADTHFKFNSIKVASVVDHKIKGTRWVSIPPMDRNGYSCFCLIEMANHVDSEFVLIFQQDGFIVNPELWSEDFLQYDYIGAPWPHMGPLHVGNGGFCLRSKKLLLAVKAMGYSPGNEDMTICYKYIRELEKQGLKFAPVSVARRFSVELPIDSEHIVRTSFGQHGNYQASQLPI